MRQGDLHPIDEYLSDDWLEEWTQAGIGTIELYLATYPAEHADANPPPPPAEA